MSFRSTGRSRDENLYSNSNERDRYEDDYGRSSGIAQRSSSTRKMQLDLDMSSEESDNGRDRVQHRSQSKYQGRDREYDSPENRQEDAVVRVVQRNRSQRFKSGDFGTVNYNSGNNNANASSNSGFVPRDLRSSQNSFRNIRDNRRDNSDYGSHQNYSSNNSRDREEDGESGLPWNKTPKRFLVEDTMESSSNTSNNYHSRNVNEASGNNNNHKSSARSKPSSSSSNQNSRRSRDESNQQDQQYRSRDASHRDRERDGDRDREGRYDRQSAASQANGKDARDHRRSSDRDSHNQKVSNAVRRSMEADFEIEEDEEESETSYIMDKRNFGSLAFNLKKLSHSQDQQQQQEEEDEGGFHYSPKSNSSHSNIFKESESQSSQKPLPKSPPKKSRRPLPTQQSHYQQPITGNLRQGSWVGSGNTRGTANRARAYDAGAQSLEDAEDNDEDYQEEEPSGYERNSNKNEREESDRENVDNDYDQNESNPAHITPPPMQRAQQPTSATTATTVSTSSLSAAANVSGGLSIATPMYQAHSSGPGSGSGYYGGCGLSPYTPTHLISSQTGYIVNPENPRASFVLISYPKGWRAPLVQCTIIRDRNSLHGKLYPTYEMILEEPKKTIIIAQKMSMNRTSNYHFFDMTRGVVSTKLSKKAGNYLGKLRAKNTNRTAYTLLNHNQDKEEIAAVLFERPSLMDTWMDGNQPRKMKVLLPQLDGDSMPMASRVDDGTFVCESGQMSTPTPSGRTRSPSFGATLYSNFTSSNNNSNTNDAAASGGDKETGSSSMIRILEDVDDVKRPLPQQFRICHTKEPTFVNGNYRLNFHGRVTVPSVKNFQIVSEFDVDDVVCQFGKVDNDVFHLDYKAPLNAFQAFALALCQFNL